MSRSLDEAIQAAVDAGVELDKLVIPTIYGQISESVRTLIASRGRKGTYLVNTDGVMYYISPAALRMLGYPEDELVGKVTHSLIHYRKPDGSPYPIEECAVRNVTEPRIVDDVLWTKGGTPVCAYFWVAPIVVDGEITGTAVTFERMKDPEQ